MADQQFSLVQAEDISFSKFRPTGSIIQPARAWKRTKKLEL
jgi:hypothetical protein